MFTDVQTLILPTLTQKFSVIPTKSQTRFFVYIEQDYFKMCMYLCNIYI